MNKAYNALKKLIARSSLLLPAMTVEYVHMYILEQQIIRTLKMS